MTAHITIAGVGLHGAEHMSREAQDAVRSARVIFTSTYNGGIDEHVRALAPRTRSWEGLPIERGEDGEVLAQRGAAVPAELAIESRALAERWERRVR